jgi:ankyrin repeat protein
VDALNHHGHTPLHRACMRGRAAAVGALLRAGAAHSQPGEQHSGGRPAQLNMTANPMSPLN